MMSASRWACSGEMRASAANLELSLTFRVSEISIKNPTSVTRQQLATWRVVSSL